MMRHYTLSPLYSVVLMTCLALPAFAETPPAPATTEATATPETADESASFEERVKTAVAQARAAAMSAQQSKEEAVKGVLKTEEMIKNASDSITALEAEAMAKKAEYDAVLNEAQAKLSAEIEKAKQQAAQSVAVEIEKAIEAARQAAMQKVEAQISAIADAQLNHAVKVAEESAIKVVTAKFAEAQALQDHAVQSKDMAERYQAKIQAAHEALKAAKAEKMQAIQGVLAKENAAKAALEKYETAKAAADKFYAEKEAARLEAIRRAAAQFDKDIQQSQ